MLKLVTLTITNCTQCPNCKTERTPRAGCAEDYYCLLAPVPNDSDIHHVRIVEGGYKEHMKICSFRIIKGYVEWPSEEPKDNEIPDWCPLNKQ